jgi:hypothetical protein
LKEITAMSMSAARIRSMFLRREQAHNSAFMSAGQTATSKPTQVPAAPEPEKIPFHRALGRRETVMQQFGAVIQRELAKAGLP